MNLRLRTTVGFLASYLAAATFAGPPPDFVNISITKNDGVSSAVAGGSVTYVIVVTNQGTLDETGITVDDTFPAACLSVDYTSTAKGGSGNTEVGSGNIADTLSLAASGTVTYFATCQIDPGAAGSLNNTATVDSPNDNNSDDNTAQDVDELVPGVNLSISKDDGTLTVVDGEVVEYAIVMSNIGSTDALDSSVLDLFPPELTGCSWTCTVVTGLASCPAAGAGNISGDVDLAAGSSVRFDATCTVNAGGSGTVTNTASAQPPKSATDTDPSDNEGTDIDQVVEAAQADLSITKDDGVVSVAPGGSVTYTITASNLGQHIAEATVTDTFPAQCSSVNYTSVAAGGATGNTAAGAGNLNETLHLPVNASVVYTATCVVSGAATGTLTNNVAIAPAASIPPVTDPNSGNDSATDTDAIVAPPTGAELSGTKTVAGAPFNVGGNVTYTVVLTNNGAGPQGDNANDEFTDVLPAQLALVSASATSGTAVANVPTNTVTWNGGLAVGASVTITIQATILPGTEGQVALNQGTVFFDSTGGGTNDASTTTDDPTVGGAADPTLFTVAGGTVPPPSEIPALSDLGAGALALLLGGMALRRMRR